MQFIVKFITNYTLDTNKCSNYNNFRIRFSEGHIMDDGKEEYRGKIIEAVNKIENVYWLRSIYIFIKTLLE